MFNQVKSNKLKSSEKDEILKFEVESALKKKERLPSSEEVYNRILWDSELAEKMNDLIILYEDRFNGLKETVFSSFEVGTIPFHRIQIFKYKDIVFYSRKERLYNFDLILNYNHNNNQHNQVYNN